MGERLHGAAQGAQLPSLMTRPLRRAHLTIWIVLALALPAMLGYAIVNREAALTPNANLAREKER